MKKIFKGIFRLITTIISMIIVVIILAGVWYGFQGYDMYRKAVEETPVSLKAEMIQSRSGYTEFDELPEIYVDAVISVEDKRFYDHFGVDVIAIGRAVWNDIRTLSFAEGGSTITQQLMKNEYFTQEKRPERKVAEILAAIEFEKEFSKNEIFEMYVNTIYFGSGYYGIYEAAEGYYGKTPGELTDYESVMLAGLPNAPSSYSPDINPQLAVQRMKIVLDSMIRCGVITETEAENIITSGS